jgi:4-hydroxy-tetrahydrodipicolinate reductase
VAVSRPVRLVVCGVGGRMGSRILNAARSEEDLLVVGATERPSSARVGLDAGLITGAGPLEVQISGSLEAALDRGPADVVIDFTTAEASLHHASVCAAKRVALVVGTTGFSPEQRARLAAHAGTIALLCAPNMSVGVNVLFRAVSEVAKALGPAYECEVVELHHRQKRDAPSGTALRLAEAAAQGLGLQPAPAFVYERHGDVGQRKPGTIGLQTLRGGDVVGEHTVYFLADGERLELTHRATSRDNFARGAVRAARFLRGKPAGLYDMQDVLGFPKPT